MSANGVQPRGMSRAAVEALALSGEVLDAALLDEVDQFLEALTQSAVGAAARERFVLRLRAFRAMRSRAGRTKA